MRQYILLILIIISFTACSTDTKYPTLNKILKENNLKIVDYNHIDKIVKNLDKSSSTIIVDARSQKSYAIGHIPSAVLITKHTFDVEFQKYKSLDKNQEFIVYCGGKKCNQSINIAKKISSYGFNNVKIYLNGFPEWYNEHTYSQITKAMTKNLLARDEAIFIDLRDKQSFRESHIDSAINIPSNTIENTNLLPKDKSEIIVLYSYKGSKEIYNIAQKLLSKKYFNIKIYTGELSGIAEKKIKTDSDCLVQTNKYVKTSKNSGEIDSQWLMEFLNSNTIPKNVTLIDTRSYNEYKSGHIKGAMNIEYKDNPQEFIDRTSHIDGAFILYCSTGTRSIDAYTSIQKLKNKTKDRFFYFDATVQCDNKNRCNIEPNFSLDF